LNNATGLPAPVGRVKAGGGTNRCRPRFVSPRDGTTITGGGYSQTVKGPGFLLTGGHEPCPLLATSSARRWPRNCPTCARRTERQWLAPRWVWGVGARGSVCDEDWNRILNSGLILPVGPLPGPGLSRSRSASGGVPLVLPAGAGVDGGSAVAGDGADTGVSTVGHQHRGGHAARARCFVSHSSVVPVPTNSRRAASSSSPVTHPAHPRGPGHHRDPAVTQHPSLGPHRQPSLTLIQMREQRRELRRQRRSDIRSHRHTTTMPPKT